MEPTSLSLSGRFTLLVPVMGLYLWPASLVYIRGLLRRSIWFVVVQEFSAMIHVFEIQTSSLFEIVVNFSFSSVLKSQPVSSGTRM